MDRAQERLLKAYIPGESMDQLKAMCDLLDPARLNIDYFPTNFIVQQGRLYYIDYACNGYMPEWDYEHCCRQHWCRTEEFLAHFQQKNG